MTVQSSRHLVDPQLLGLLDSLPPLKLSDEILPLVREGSRLPPRVVPEPTVPVFHEIRTVPGPAGSPDVALYIYRPEAAAGPLPCILHVHGGGYVTGSPSTQIAAHRSLAAALSCCIVSVDYRRAPETRFPGAVEDCYAGLAWVTAHAAELRIDVTDPAAFDPGLLEHEREGLLLGALGDFPRVVATAAELREPHRVARYLEELAGTYPRFYDACRVLPQGDEDPTPLTTARLWLCAATRTVLANGLDLLGVSAPDRM